MPDIKIKPFALEMTPEVKREINTDNLIPMNKESSQPDGSLSSSVCTNQNQNKPISVCFLKIKDNVPESELSHQTVMQS